VAVEVADQLRVGVAKLVGGQLVVVAEMDVEVPAAEVPERVPVEIVDLTLALLRQRRPERSADRVP
jgi:hypothetical protein